MVHFNRLIKNLCTDRFILFILLLLIIGLEQAMAQESSRDEDSSPISETDHEAKENGFKKTVFKFGGYVKADFLNTWYSNGDVESESPLRDFHLPGQIPVGPRDQHYDMDFHIKESRINFDVKSTVWGKEIHGFVELDFMLSKQGDEKVTNSFSPRLRHFYFEWDRLLIGQTWSSFMMVVIPDEIDFTGALDGLVFVRQPQIRYKHKNWWFALENPETTINPYSSSDIEVADSEIFPDVIVRRNFHGDWGNWGIAGIYRTLHRRDSTRQTTSGYGLTTGGKFYTGKKGDDLRLVVTAGKGLGRYLSANFIAGAITDEIGRLHAIGSVNGYIAFNHYWKPRKLSSSFSVAAFHAFDHNPTVSDQVNLNSYSISGNLKYDPLPVLRFGIEYAYAYREILNGVDGCFHRIQLAAKYTFGYHNEAADEKR